MRPVPNSTLPAMTARTGPSARRSDALIDGFRLRGIHFFPTLSSRERPHAHRLGQGNRRRHAPPRGPDFARRPTTRAVRLHPARYDSPLRARTGRRDREPRPGLTAGGRVRDVDPGAPGPRPRTDAVRGPGTHLPTGGFDR